MNKRLIALAVIALIAAPAAAVDKTAVMAPVRQFVAAFNKGDVPTAAAQCTEQAAIIDEFPPYVWHGGGACTAWMEEYDADAKSRGISDGFVILSAPRLVEVKGDRAYVVAPASYAYNMKGSTHKETDSILTVALQKIAAGWRITGWSWAKH
jgi:ketosteroid isomerase-like protein